MKSNNQTYMKSDYFTQFKLKIKPIESGCLGRAPPLWRRVTLDPGHCLAPKTVSGGEDPPDNSQKNNDKESNRNQ